MASETKTGANEPPLLLDLTIDNITSNTIRINSQSSDARLKYVMERLVTHLHDFARETRLSTPEWMKAITFLIGCGKICTDVRNVRSHIPYYSPLFFPLFTSGIFFPGTRVDVSSDLTNTRNSSCYRTSWACLCWWTTSTTRSRRATRRAPCWVRSTLMTPLCCPMAAP